MTKNQELKEKLSCQLQELNHYLGTLKFDFIVGHCEVNNYHGVGIILQRIFGNGTNKLYLRSHDLYDGYQWFADYDICVKHESEDRQEMKYHLYKILGKKSAKRILSIPYYTEDVLTSILLKEIYNVPLCTYIMDDQNIYQPNIPDDLMQELIEKSDICLGISAEICDEYKKKYNHQFWWLPPVVESNLISQNCRLPSSNILEEKEGILIGNIWGQKWLDKLRSVLRNSLLKINWYGNPNREWLKFSDSKLKEDGIFFQGYCSQNHLIDKLRKSPYALITTAIADDFSAENRQELAFLSLPSRLIFMIATANIPIIVMGSQKSAVAKFVEKHHLGYVCNYDSDDFASTVEQICLPKNQEKFRLQASKLANLFSAEDVEDWIWESLAQKRACNFKFEKLRQIAKNADVIITLDEMNQRHGTGALVRRIFPDSSNIISIRSCNHYEGEQGFGRINLPLYHNSDDRLKILAETIKVLEGHEIKRIFCVPYKANELKTAMAIKEKYNVPLGTYIMDDQNICINNINDELMEEFLTKCSIRFATHPELRDAYEQKFGLKFWVLPAIVPHNLIENNPATPDQNLFNSKTGALIGSIWSRQWFDMLTSSITEAGVKLDWYGNYKYFWLTESLEEINQQGINPCGLLKEQKLAKTLQNYPYVVVPTGTLDDRDDRHELSQLSLPGRILFVLATSNTPIILIGSEKTSPAQFIKRFQIGVVCDYNVNSFREAVDYVTNSDKQNKMRQNAAKVAKYFSDEGITEWVWKSLELGEPCSSKFEDLMCGSFTESS